jgi:type II secretory ATPase GspE/PulE/Tfp pilus assembly ATPase PilB-like protein
MYAVLSRAIDLGASDVHFTPQRNRMLVRARIDGVMRELATITKNLQPAVTSRLKVMAELDIAEKRAPQDGRLSLRAGDRSVDLRVAVLPTTHGEKVTLRIMNSGAAAISLEELGMSGTAAEGLIATSLHCIVAQRLARKLCQDCRESYEPDETELADLACRPSSRATRGSTARPAANLLVHGLLGARRPLRGDADPRRDPRADRELDRRDLRRRGQGRYDDDAPGRIRLTLAGVTTLAEVRGVTGERMT